MSSHASSPQRDMDSPSASPKSALAMSAGSDSEDDAILRPRGRLAARLQAQNTETNDASSATERGSGSDNDDDIVTTRPRKKLQQRRQRSTTPQPRPQQDEASPALFVSPEKSAPASPGLFVSPSKQSLAGPASEGEDSDDDLPGVGGRAKNKRFLALIAKKKQERDAREAEEAKKQAERLAAQQLEDMSMVDDEDDNITDDDGGRKLTQGASRPSARKASKKALEEMNRETQRLTRSLQLAHEAKVKKKITKSALFERFNFKPEGAAEPAKVVSSRATTPGSGLQTDVEMKDTETPPSSTSPPHSTKGDAQEAGPDSLEHILEENSDGELPSLEDAIRSSAAAPKVGKGKGKATAADFEAEDHEKAQQQKPKRNIRVKLPDLHANRAKVQLDDDDDLDIQPSHKNKMDAIFNRVPVNQAKESRPMYMLRMLAQVDDPEKKATAAGSKRTKLRKDQPPPMTIGELQQSLFQRSRAQAKLERDRHLEMLRSKGIHVPTAEEREREEAEIEDLVARAKREAEEIMSREREEAKQDRKAGRAAGEDDPLGWDDSDESGDDYVDEEEEPAELELSGSEEEGEGMDVDEEEGVESAGLLIDDAADSAEESEGGDAEEPTGGQDSDEEGISTAKQPARRRQRKQLVVLSDDEEEVEQTPRIVEATPRPKANFFKSPRAPNTGSPSIPTSVLRSATKTFIPGLPVAGAAGLGLTQIFAGTMDDSQMGSAPEFGSPSQPRPTFDVTDLPDSNFSQTAENISPDVIMDSQPAGRTQEPETQGVQFNFAQSQALGFDTLLRDSQQDASQMSLIEPTQDGGYQDYSPLVRRFVEAPASTVETVKLHESQGDADENQSPLVKRTGRLRRRADLVSAAADSDSEMDVQDSVAVDETDEFGFGTVKPTTKPSAFNVMQDAAIKKKKVAEAFDKKKSKARDMVQDQAEESEDEYAGLGGVDGEDSDDDDAQSVKEMIDDETKQNETDERKTAAFYADRERAADEKQVEKLFHDITTGMLRRKRGGDWDDLDDEDDGGEARRRLKRRQFAKMQRALFSDERISKVAENPRNQAFLKTIEDAGSDDDMDFLFAPPPRVPGLDSQDSQASDASTTPAAAVTIPDSQPQPNPRRTKTKAPSNIGDIRHSLSNLLDEPLHSTSSSSVIPATDLDSNSGSDDDDDDEADEPTPTTTTTKEKETQPGNPRRRPAVVDRISLKRNSSSSLSTTSSTSNRQAFTTTTSSTSTGGFKVPALLRRATTNSLISSSSTTASRTGVTTDTASGAGAGAGAGVGKIKKSAGKRSGISYLARENERRAAVSEMEARREAKKWKGAEGRGKVVGGLFGGGKFE